MDHFSWGIIDRSLVLSCPLPATNIFVHSLWLLCCFTDVYYHIERPQTSLGPQPSKKVKAEVVTSERWIFGVAFFFNQDGFLVSYWDFLCILSTAKELIIAARMGLKGDRIFHHYAFELLSGHNRHYQLTVPLRYFLCCFS